MKISSMPRNCVLLAVSTLTDVPEDKIIEAFQKTRCYRKTKGSVILNISKALKRLNLAHDDSTIVKALKGTKKLVLDKGFIDNRSMFINGVYLVHVVEFNTDDNTHKFHTIGVSDGVIFGLSLKPNIKTYYVGHHELTGPRIKNI